MKGFLDLRAEVFALGIQGFQWLDGSFLENIEMQEGRDPKDLDAVTFVTDPATPVDLSTRLAMNPNLLDHAHVKGTYSVDHYWVSIGSDPVFLVDQTRYWYGLFSHRRDRVWKGMLVVNLINKADDDDAHVVLGSKP